MSAVGRCGARRRIVLVHSTSPVKPQFGCRAHPASPAFNEESTALTMAPSAETPVSADIARSWLLINGAHSDTFDKAAQSRADQIILDIEDAVDPQAKPTARADVIEWLSNGGSGWVRINDRLTDFWSDDVD